MVCGEPSRHDDDAVTFLKRTSITDCVKCCVSGLGFLSVSGDISSYNSYPLSLSESADSYTFIDNIVLIALASFGSTTLELREENIVRNHVHLHDGANCETNQKNENNTRPKTDLVLRNLSFTNRGR